jgi:hypothetical protein
MAESAMKLKGAAKKLNIQIVIGSPTTGKPGMGLVHHLKHLSGSSAQNIYIQMPRAVTFGIRESKMNSTKWGLTLKYRTDQQAALVDELRAVHELIKMAICEKFDTILPKCTQMLVERMHKKNKKFPLTLFSGEDVAPKDQAAYDDAMNLFMEEASDKVDEIFTFGASEAQRKLHEGRPKMVTFAPAKTTADGKSFDASYMVNLACGVKSKKGGGMEFHPASEDGRRGPPHFNFTACESPESQLIDVTDIPNEEILSKLAPIDGAPFARDGVAVVNFPYIHVREDESSIAMNISLEHFHCYQRDQVGLGKRTFAVMEDDDTPQVTSAEQDNGDSD